MTVHVEPTRRRQHGRKVWLTKTGAERIAACREIVASASFGKIDGCMVDLFSASAIVRVYDAVNQANQEKFARLSIAKMAKVAFQLLK